MKKFNFYKLKTLVFVVLLLAAKIVVAEPVVAKFPVPISGQSTQVLSALNHLSAFELSASEIDMQAAFGINDTSIKGLYDWIGQRIDLILVESHFFIEVEFSNKESTIIAYDYDHPVFCVNQGIPNMALHLSSLLKMESAKEILNCWQSPLSAPKNALSSEQTINYSMIHQGTKYSEEQNVVSLNSKFFAQPKSPLIEHETHAAIVLSTIIHEARHSDDHHFHHVIPDSTKKEYIRDAYPNGPYTLEAAILLHLAKGIKNKNSKSALEILSQAILKLYYAPQSDLSDQIYNAILATRSEIKSGLSPEQLTSLDPILFKFILL